MQIMKMLHIKKINIHILGIYNLILVSLIFLKMFLKSINSLSAIVK